MIPLKAVFASGSNEVVSGTVGQADASEAGLMIGSLKSGRGCRSEVSEVASPGAAKLATAPRSSIRARTEIARFI